MSITSVLSVLILCWRSTRQCGSSLGDLGVSNCYVIPNFLDEAAYRPKKRIYSVNDGKGVVRLGVVGSLTARKNVLPVLYALHELKATGMKLSLSIFGEGEQQSAIQQCIFELGLEKDVFIKGFETDTSIIFGSIDCLVHPSHSEGTPRAVMEALYHGIPCVLRNVDSNIDLISEGSNGFLFDNDIELKDTIAKVVTLSRTVETGENLLPEQFSQTRCRRISKVGF